MWPSTDGVRMISVNDLALACEHEFAFLETLGFPLTEWSELFPESFKGGFTLVFANRSGKRVIISYTDCEFEVRTNGKELFGRTHHEPFSGNMFSREHLTEALPRIRLSVESPLRGMANEAT